MVETGTARSPEFRIGPGFFKCTGLWAPGIHSDVLIVQSKYCRPSLFDPPAQRDCTLGAFCVLYSHQAPDLLITHWSLYVDILYENRLSCDKINMIHDTHMPVLSIPAYRPEGSFIRIHQRVPVADIDPQCSTGWDRYMGCDIHFKRHIASPVWTDGVSVDKEIDKVVDCFEMDKYFFAGHGWRDLESVFIIAFRFVFDEKPGAGLSIFEIIALPFPFPYIPARYLNGLGLHPIGSEGPCTIQGDHDGFGIRFLKIELCRTSSVKGSRKKAWTCRQNQDNDQKGENGFFEYHVKNTPYINVF